MIKAIIFDLDGTLFRTETVDVEAFNWALEDFGYGSKPAKVILDLIGYPMVEICQALLKQPNAEEVSKFSQRVLDYEKKLIWEKGELYPGVLGLLEYLKKSGYLLYICSNGDKEYVEGIAEKFEFNKFFTAICYKIEGITKSEAIKRLLDEAKPDLSIIVGDRDSDFKAALDNNSVAVGAKYGFGNEEELSLADYTIKSVQDLTKIIKIIGG